MCGVSRIQAPPTETRRKKTEQTGEILAEIENVEESKAVEIAEKLVEIGFFNARRPKVISATGFPSFIEKL